MSFVVNIFNNLLKFNDVDIMITFDTNDNIYFKLKDLLIALEYTGTLRHMNKLNIKSEFFYKIEDLDLPRSYTLPLNFQKTTKFINEAGLYQLLSKSNKPIAKTFMEKYFTEIMIDIRKTGKYASNKNDMNKINKLNDKLNNYKKELNYYYDKYDFISSNDGYFYINEDITIKNGEKMICYKIGYCDDIKKRMAVYKTGNFNHKLILYIALNFNGKILEDCVKGKLKSHLIKSRTDTICYISLKKLKKEIITCLNDINNHICECVTCKNKYNLNDMDIHECYNNKIIDVGKKPTRKSSKKPTRKSSKKPTRKSSKKIEK